ncbi:MAG: MoxR family ATPase [Ginsengibacter sp.]
MNDKNNSAEIKLASIYLNTSPGDYYADENLIKAVEIAIALGKPLLISGEPGTGKTQLAHYVAWKLHLQTQNETFPFIEKPLIFYTKSSSSAGDLFYNYDAISHFRTKDEKCETTQFIELNAMGQAIALTHGKTSASLHGIKNIKGYNELLDEPAGSVVLIDEIDKAPRDFPNDLLNEMENFEFDIREINQTIRRADNGARMVIIMTSNSEKNLPNAFLRRCVYYNIPFPDEEKLFLITKQRLSIGNEDYDIAINKAIQQFLNYRNQAVNKKPATSEFIDWVRVLKDYNLLGNDFSPTPRDSKVKSNYRASLNVLFKSNEDLEKVIK